MRDFTEQQADSFLISLHCDWFPHMDWKAQLPAVSSDNILATLMVEFQVLFQFIHVASEFFMPCSGIL